MRTRATSLVKEFARNATHIRNVPINKLLLLGSIWDVSIGWQNEIGWLSTNWAQPSKCFVFPSLPTPLAYARQAEMVSAARQQTEASLFSHGAL